MKTADIVADVEQARDGHAKALPQIPAQRFPRCEIVTRPGLRVAANSRPAGATDDVRTLARSLSTLRFAGYFVHQHGLGRPCQRLAEGTARAIALCIFVPDLELVVVVPRRGNAMIEQCRLETVSPPVGACRIGEIDMKA